MINKCSICGGKLDALFPLLAQHPEHKICSACSIQKSYIVDAANRNDAAALQEAAQAFKARTCVSTTDAVKADMQMIIDRFQAMLLSSDKDSNEEESALIQLPTTASDSFEGHSIKKYCGNVAAQAVVLIDALQPGHESSAHVAKLNNRRQMLIQAKGLGGNALINCAVQYITLNSKYLFIASTGDAVLID